MAFFKKIGRRLKRGQPDIYEAANNYAKSKGLRLEDVVAAATSAYISTDQEGREELEQAIAERNAREGGQRSSGGMGGLKEALELFREMTDITVDMMTKSQEAGQKLLKGSLLNEVKNQAQTIEEIKQIGATGGKGSIEDTLANAFVAGLLQRAGVNVGGGAKTPTSSGKGKIEKVDEQP